jgi:hypothetical protein
MSKSIGSRLWPNLLVFVLALVLLGGATGMAFAVTSNYIPAAVPTVTSTLYSNGSTSMTPGRVVVDKAGNVFFVNHATYTVYEIPVSATTTPNAPVPLLTGLTASSGNNLFLDASGVLWVANNGSTLLVEIPALNGIPNTALVANGGSGTSISSISTACTASPTTACYWSNTSIQTPSSTSGAITSITAIADIFSDGAGNVFLLDSNDSASSGSYDQIIRFSTSSPTTATYLARCLGDCGSYAYRINSDNADVWSQITVAGDGNLYFLDSPDHSGGTGSVYLIGPAYTAGTSSNGYNVQTATPSVEGTTASLGSPVQIATAYGITTDPWGNLIIAGAQQISEIPLESGSLNFSDEFCLLNASGQSSTYYPIISNNVFYGGNVDSFGNYYYASYYNVMKVQVGGYNFGSVAVGTVTTSPYLDLYINLLSTIKSNGFPTFTIPSLGSNYSLLQSFPFGGTRSFTTGGSSFGPAGSGNYQAYLNMSFQPVHAGLLRGSFAPVSSASTDVPWLTANLQGVGSGPQTLLLPGTASTSMALASLYTTPEHTASPSAFKPQALALDTFGDIYVADTANSTVDVSCLTSTGVAAQASTANPTTDNYCQSHNGYSFELGTAFVSPVAIALDGANAVYVLDSSSSTSTNPVTKLVPTMNAGTLAMNDAMTASAIVPNGATIAGTALSNPQGMAIDGYSNIYIADTGNNRIVQAHQFNAPYSQNVVYVSSTTTFGGTKLSGPTGLAVDAAGDLFIADTGNNRIVEYSITGVASVVSASGITLKSPNGVAILPSGALIVSDKNNIVSLIDGGVGTELSFLTSTGTAMTPGTPAGVALDLFGNIYVSDPTNSRVVELNVNTPATMPTYPTTSVGNSSADVDLYVYNAGTAPLTFSVAPSISDTTDFAIDASSTTCSTSTSVSAASECTLAVYFKPQSAGVLYTTATLTDNQHVVTAATTAVTNGYEGTFAASSSQTAAFSSTFTPQTIAFVNPGAQTVGTPLTLAPTTSSAGLAVTYTSSTTGVCTVSGYTATFVISGSCTIVASQAGNTTYGPVSVGQTFAVNGEPQSINFTNPGAQLYVYAMTVPLSATASPSGLTVSLASNTTSVCTVSGTSASILSTGTCSITASQAGNASFAAASQVTQSFTISNPLPVLGSLSTANASWGAPTFTLTVKGTGFVGSPISGTTAPTSTVYWDSTALATTYVSPTQLTAVVHVFSTDQAGIHSITVVSPTPGGGTSNAMQFEVDSEFAAPSAPNFSSLTAAVTAGSSATYPVTLPSTATNVSVACLNLPSGAACSYASNVVTITTASSTPKGTYQIVVVFTETIPGSVPTTALVLLPILLLPLALLRRKLASRGFLYTAVVGLMLLVGSTLFSGCTGSTVSTSHQVTSSAAVTLTVQ